MITLSRALSAEVLKTKRTLTLGLAFLAPLAVAFLEFVMHMQMGERAMKPGAERLDQPIATQPDLVDAAHAAAVRDIGDRLVERAGTQQQDLEAIVRAASAALGGLCRQAVDRDGTDGLEHIVMVAMIVGVGLLLNLFRPTLGFVPPIPWPTIIQTYPLIYLASWLIISLHLWVSAHWSSFVVAMGVGIVATVAGVMVINSDWAKYYPWTLPVMVSVGFVEGEAIGAQVALGIIGGIVIALAGGWDVTRRDVL